jgi:hypothetical protein
MTNLSMGCDVLTSYDTTTTNDGRNGVDYSVRGGFSSYVDAGTKSGK